MKKLLFCMLFLAIMFSFSFGLKKGIKVDVSACNDFFSIDGQEGNELSEITKNGNDATHNLPHLGECENLNSDGNFLLDASENVGDASVCGDPNPSLGDGENHDGNGNGGILGDTPNPEKTDK